MRGFLATLTVALLLGALPVPADAAPVRNCGRATVVMPSAEAHRAWLEKDPRYIADDAAAFGDKVKHFGPHVLDYQVIVAEVMSASAWFDLEGHGACARRRCARSGSRAARLTNTIRWWRWSG
jgi:hypothetical protein